MDVREEVVDALLYLWCRRGAAKRRAQPPRGWKQRLPRQQGHRAECPSAPALVPRLGCERCLSAHVPFPPLQRGTAPTNLLPLSSPSPLPYPPSRTSGKNKTSSSMRLAAIRRLRTPTVGRCPQDPSTALFASVSLASGCSPIAPNVAARNSRVIKPYDFGFKFSGPRQTALDISPTFGDTSSSTLQEE